MTYLRGAVIITVPLFFMLKALSLFANAGFGEYYLKEIGVNVVVAKELLDDRVSFYKKINP